jgi:hypothetical protein
VERLGIDHVSVLKINVAGFEPEVIEGAMPILAQERVDVLVLLIGRPSYRAYRELSGLGYRFFFFHPRSQRLHEISSIDDEGLIVNRPWPARNVLAIRAKAIAAILDGRVTIEPPIASMGPGRRPQSAGNSGSLARPVQFKSPASGERVGDGAWRAHTSGV